MDIKNLSGVVLFTHESQTIKETIIAAVKSGADLSDANLCGADLRGAHLRGAYLRGAYLRGANLSDADLRIAELRDADLRGANLSDANMSGAYLSGAYLRGAYLRGAELRDADLRSANLSDANMSGAYLSGAYLRDAHDNKKKIATMRVFIGLYEYQVWAVLFEDGSRWVRMGCLWKSLDEWGAIGIRKSNLSQYPDDGSDKSEERVAAFDFAKDATIRMK
jgi:uncharacterized protein YjbI with pentapeptide repeats